MSLMLWKTREANLHNVIYPAIKDRVMKNKGKMPEDFANNIGYYQKILSLLVLK